MTATTLCASRASRMLVNRTYALPLTGSGDATSGLPARILWEDTKMLAQVRPWKDMLKVRGEKETTWKQQVKLTLRTAAARAGGQERRQSVGWFVFVVAIPVIVTGVFTFCVRYWCWSTCTATPSLLLQVSHKHLDFATATAVANHHRLTYLGRQPPQLMSGMYLLKRLYSLRIWQGRSPPRGERFWAMLDSPGCVGLSKPTPLRGGEEERKAENAGRARATHPLCRSPWDRPAMPESLGRLPATVVGCSVGWARPC